MLEQIRTEELVDWRRTICLGFRRSLVLNSLHHAAVNALLELVESLHLVDTVDQIGNHRANLLFLLAELGQRSVRVVELIARVKVSLVFVSLDVEKSLWVLREADSRHASSLTGDPVVLANFTLAVLRVAEHSNHVNTSAS